MESMIAKPRFRVSYRGEADYTYNGAEYRVRSFAEDDGHYNGNYYETGIEPFTGCISNKHGDFFAFPPQEVIEVFREEHPGIVGARYTDETFTTVEYTAPRSIYTENSTVYADWMKRYAIVY